MKLGDLLEGVAGAESRADAALEISSLAYDSRQVRPGMLFFAISGEKTDGHNFVSTALEHGAAAIVSQRECPPGLVSRWIRVPRIRPALAMIAQNFFGHPDSRLRLVGITGTNGKTTTAFLLESILKMAGMHPGLFGTVEYRLGDRILPAHHTTPESLDLLSHFSEILRGGGDSVVMEVSSHALAQERVWGFHFDVAVFTNLTRDHLDYHHDFDAYFAAKRRLFEGLGSPPPDVAVLNVSDPWGVRLLDLPAAQHITYGLAPEAQVRPRHFVQRVCGLRATLATPVGKLAIESRLIGRANLFNILAAVAAALGLGLPGEAIRKGIAALSAVPGRFERVDEGQPFLVVVDYAHTDDALTNVLNTARELTHNRLIVVFGCGGDRDRQKRCLMGEVAGSLSDLVILTSDNPRSEDPLLIMNDVLVGLQRSPDKYVAEVSREAAIRKALATAREGDAVVIAGKGHETYQIIGENTIHFDDREVVRQVLHEMKFDSGSQSGGEVNAN
jgi:UDP-N-acetylmuramoyl-L-alanyl-D-glutamate--2,6-diaminopimelate ligase